MTSDPARQCIAYPRVFSKLRVALSITPGRGQGPHRKSRPPMPVLDANARVHGQGRETKARRRLSRLPRQTSRYRSARRSEFSSNGEHHEQDHLFAHRSGARRHRHRTRRRFRIARVSRPAARVRRRQTNYARRRRGDRRQLVPLRPRDDVARGSARRHVHRRGTNLPGGYDRARRLARGSGTVRSDERVGEHWNVGLARDLQPRLHRNPRRRGAVRVRDAVFSVRRRSRACVGGRTRWAATAADDQWRRGRAQRRDGGGARGDHGRQCHRALQPAASRSRSRSSRSGRGDGMRLSDSASLRVLRVLCEKPVSSKEFLAETRRSRRDATTHRSRRSAMAARTGTARRTAGDSSSGSPQRSSPIADARSTSTQTRPAFEACTLPAPNE